MAKFREFHSEQDYNGAYVDTMCVGMDAALAECPRCDEAEIATRAVVFAKIGATVEGIHRIMEAAWQS